MVNPANEMIYVSWGGSGRGAALREAYEQASSKSQSLTYLAILDPPHFADLDDNLLGLVVEELEWLLTAHLYTVTEASESQTDTRVIVRTGEVDDEVEELVEATGATTVVIGAPLTAAGKPVAELVEALEHRTGAKVQVIGPDTNPA